jgi:hypothetical protein
MAYGKLLEKLEPYRLAELGRISISTSADTTVMIGNEREAMVPFPSASYILRSPAGTEDFHVPEDDVRLLLQRFNIPAEDIFSDTP